MEPERREWPMWRRIAVRVALLPLIFVAVSAFSHFVLYGPFAERPRPRCLTNGVGCPPEVVDQVEERLGLNDPWIQQYGRWLADAVRGDFGRSYVTFKPVLPEIAGAIPPTAEILVIALIVAVAVAYTLALLREQGSSVARHSGLVIAALLAAIPVVLSLVLLIVLPSRWWSYAAPTGFISPWEDPARNLRLVAPGAAVIGITLSVAVLAFTRFDVRSFRTLRLLQAVFLAAALALPALSVVEVLYAIDGAGWQWRGAIITVDLPVIQAWASLLLTVGVGAMLFATMAAADEIDRANAVPAVTPRRLLGDPLIVVGLAFCLLFVVVALVGPELNNNWRELDPRTRFDGPSLDHLFGTNRFGQDLLGQTFASARSALVLLAKVVAFGFLPGFIVGAFVAQRSRTASRVTREVSTYLLVAPTLIMFALFVGAQRFDIDDNPLVIAMSLFTFAVGLRFGADGIAGAGSFREALSRRWMGALEGVCWTAAFTLLFTGTADFLHLGNARGSRASFGSTIEDGVAESVDHLHAFLAPGLTLTVIVFGFLLIALRLAAWRWEAERAPSSARSRTQP